MRTLWGAKSWGAKFWGVIALMVAAAASAQEVRHTRGEFAFTVAPEPAFAQVQELPPQWEATAPGFDEQSWRVWRFDEQVDHRNGRDDVFVDYAYEARASANLGEAGRFDIDFNPLYQTLAIHRVEVRRDGRWQSRLDPDRISLARREAEFEQDMADGQVTALIVMEDVRVGDVVRVRYTIQGSNPILVGQLVDGTRFGWQSPTLDTRLRVLYDPGTSVAVRREHDAPQARIQEIAGATEVTLASHATPAYNDEGSYPDWYMPFPMAQVAPRRSWADVVAWALPLYAGADEVPADLAARVAQWSKLPDPQARLDAALRLVQDEVRYFGIEMGENTHRPNPPALTWSRRYGDCKDKATLLVALLRRLDIPAVPALVSVDSGRGIKDSPPGGSLFDHVVVRAQIGEQVLWVDPTMTDQGGQARDSDLGDYGMGLPIRAGVTALEAIPASTGKSRLDVTEGYELLPDGQRARLDILTTYTGAAADDARRTVANQRVDDLSRQYADYYRRRFGDLDVVAPPVVEDDRAGNVIRVTEKYLLKSPYEDDGNLRALDVYAETLDGAAELPESLERHAPLDFGQPMQLRHVVEVHLPEHWTTPLGDEKQELESPAFKYARALTVADRRIHLVYDLDMTARDVSAADVGAHLQQVRKLREDLSARLPLRMPRKAQDTARDDRLKALLKDVMEGK